MKRLIFRLLLIILFLCGLFYFDSYHPFVVVSICLLISLMVLPFLAMFEDRRANIWMIFIIFWFVSGFYIFRGYQIEPWEKDRVALVPPFYPIFGEVIAVGEKVDTLQNLSEGFISDEGKISTGKTTVYVLHLDSTSSLLFSSTQIILERGRHLLFEPRYFRFGWIDTVSYLDENDNRRYIDLLGHDITISGYAPTMNIIPPTPDYY